MWLQLKKQNIEIEAFIYFALDKLHDLRAASTMVLPFLLCWIRVSLFRVTVVWRALSYGLRRWPPAVGVDGNIRDNNRVHLTPNRPPGWVFCRGLITSPYFLAYGLPGIWSSILSAKKAFPPQNNISWRHRVCQARCEFCVLLLSSESLKIALHSSSNASYNHSTFEAYCGTLHSDSDRSDLVAWTDSGHLSVMSVLYRDYEEGIRICAIDCVVGCWLIFRYVSIFILQQLWITSLNYFFLPVWFLVPAISERTAQILSNMHQSIIFPQNIYLTSLKSMVSSVVKTSRSLHAFLCTKIHGVIFQKT
jgi:hypothetical protein